MKKCVNGIYIPMTPEEIADCEAQAKQAEAAYWAAIPYDEAVSAEFRKEYSQDRVEAIINNYLLDPTNLLFAQEMQEMQDCRARCKAFVKERKAVV